MTNEEALKAAINYCRGAPWAADEIVEGLEQIQTKLQYC